MIEYSTLDLLTERQERRDTLPISGTTSIPTEVEVSPPLYPCECGDPGCALMVSDVESWFSSDFVPHRDVLDVVAEELHLIATCRFFDDHVERSISKFTTVAAAYPRPIAARAIVEAANTWHGCPEELCGRDD